MLVCIFPYGDPFSSGFSKLSVEATDGKTVEWRYDGSLIDVCWADSFVKGEKRDVKVSYVVHKPVTGLFFSHPDSAYPNKDSFAITGSLNSCFCLPCRP